MAGIFLSRTSEAICSIRRALFTMNGISVTMIREGPSSVLLDVPPWPG